MSQCLTLLEQTVLDVVSDVCAEHMYKPETFESHKDNLLALLRRGIPPAERLDSNSETFRPFDVISILNAGWLFYEKELLTWEQWEQQFAHLDLLTRIEFLNRLLAKAMEVSFVKDAEASLP